MRGSCGGGKLVFSICFGFGFAFAFAFGFAFGFTFGIFPLKKESRIYSTCLYCFLFAFLFGLPAVKTKSFGISERGISHHSIYS
jgi:hypothetical protein